MAEGRVGKNCSLHGSPEAESQNGEGPGIRTHLQSSTSSSEAPPPSNATKS
jgi:hypothetical protein